MDSEQRRKLEQDTQDVFLAVCPLRYLFIINGVVLQTEWMIGAAIFMVIAPGIYSFILYKKGV